MSKFAAVADEVREVESGQWRMVSRARAFMDQLQKLCDTEVESLPGASLMIEPAPGLTALREGRVWAKVVFVLPPRPTGVTGEAKEVQTVLKVQPAAAGTFNLLLPFLGEQQVMDAEDALVLLVEELRRTGVAEAEQRGAEGSPFYAASV